jgi:uncharacterized protein with HEPN domain
MQEAATLACGYVDGLSAAEFLADKKTRQAVMMNLVVLGRSRHQGAEGG